MHARVQYPESIEPLVQFIETDAPRRDPRPHAGKAARRHRPQDHADRLGARGGALRRPASRPSRRPAASARRPARDHQPGRPPGRRGPLPARPPARRAVQQAHQRPGDLAVQPAGVRARSIPPAPTGQPAADLANDGAGEMITAEGIEAAKEAFLKACGRGEAQQGRPHLPVAVGPRPGDRGVRPADERGAAEERAGRPLLPVPRLSLARPGGAREGAPQGAVPPGGALRRPLPDPEAGPRGRCADRGAQPARPRPPPAHRRRRDREDRRARRSHPRLQDLPRDPQDDRPGAGRRPVAGRRRRGAVDRRGRPVPALAHRQPDGRAPAHQRQPAPLPAAARRLQHEEQAADAAAVAHRAGGEVHPVPHGADAPAGHGRGRRPAASLAGGAAGGDHPEHLHPAADRLVQGHQPRA